MLIVDDDPDIREMLVVAMTDFLLDPPEQLRVETAADLRAAREAVRVWRPEVVLLDILLPDGDGLELCRDLAADPRLASVPVVALSASSPTSGVAERARAAGCSAFLAKPLDLDELLAVVRGVMRRPGASS